MVQAVHSLHSSVLPTGRNNLDVPCVKGCLVGLLKADLILVMNTAELNRQRRETEAQWGC